MYVQSRPATEYYRYGELSGVVFLPLRVARNEVKNAPFAQRSAHREGKNMATGIDRTGRRAQATCVRTTDFQIGLPRSKDFATVQYFIL